jgi:carbon-monoxide dehydrogenase large subunit
MHVIPEKPKLVGARVKRVEDPRLITGHGRYVDDVRLPGTLHAAFIRSPHAHARLVKVDTRPALERDGVVAALTGADVQGKIKPLRVELSIAGLPSPGAP